jgi:hypothetical protein
MQQLAQNAQKVLGQGGVEEINALVTSNEGLFNSGAGPGSTPPMAQATRGLADTLGVMVNILTT